MLENSYSISIPSRSFRDFAQASSAALLISPVTNTESVFTSITLDQSGADNASSVIIIWLIMHIASPTAGSTEGPYFVFILNVPDTELSTSFNAWSKYSSFGFSFFLCFVSSLHVLSLDHASFASGVLRSLKNSMIVPYIEDTSNLCTFLCRPGLAK